MNRDGRGKSSENAILGAPQVRNRTRYVGFALAELVPAEAMFARISASSARASCKSERRRKMSDERFCGSSVNAFGVR
jgi:hypothetical protein